jgi:hypothetical protein
MTDWLEKMSVASVGVGIFQGSWQGIVVGIITTFIWYKLVRRGDV